MGGMVGDSLRGRAEDRDDMVEKKVKGKSVNFHHNPC